MSNIAPIWKRFLAYFIDLGIHLTITVSLIYFVVASGEINVLLNRLLAIVSLTIFIWPILFTLLDTLMISYLGGTFGKLLTGTKIVNPQGKQIDLKRAFFRNKIGYMISGILLCGGFFWVFIDKERRTWHDQIADTYVISTNKWMFVIGIIALVALVLIDIYLGSLIISNKELLLSIVSRS